jgi:hypothetical protein
VVAIVDAVRYPDGGFNSQRQAEKKGYANGEEEVQIAPRPDVAASRSAVLFYADLTRYRMSKP